MRPSLGQNAPVARTLLRARVVLPIAGPALEDGGVLIGGRQIVGVGRWKDLSSSRAEAALDLGDVMLLPGLINAHCHLDYTDMAGQIPPPRSFSEWIKAMLALKAHQSYSDYALAWLRGAKMLATHGTTTVVDIEAVPELLPEVSSATPLRVCSLLEMTGLRSRRTPAQILQATTATLTTLARQGCWVGLSPHAPYSTTPELLRLVGLSMRARDWLLAIHLSESAEEFEMFSSRRGRMFTWLGQQRDMADCGLGSPVQCLQRQGLLGPNLLAIHVNYLAPGDAELLANGGVHVVHCPRSRAYFSHTPFPRAVLQHAGVNLCLGTDSLATIRRTSRAKPELDLFAEMRALSDHDPDLSPENIVRMATVNPARALQRSGALGQLSPGARADLIAIPLAGRTVDFYTSVIAHTGPVSAMMIDGQWVLRPAA
ncbi:MAG: amidohydrolase family protein [Verrucomicrobiota bacterium]